MDLNSFRVRTKQSNLSILCLTSQCSILVSVRGIYFAHFAAKRYGKKMERIILEDLISKAETLSIKKVINGQDVSRWDTDMRRNLENGGASPSFISDIEHTQASRAHHVGESETDRSALYREEILNKADLLRDYRDGLKVTSLGN